MREIFTYGSVGGAPGNRCFYLEPERLLLAVNRLDSALCRAAGTYFNGERTLCFKHKYFSTRWKNEIPKAC